jgi:hypothetical protein
MENVPLALFVRSAWVGGVDPSILARIDEALAPSISCGTERRQKGDTR